MTIEEIKKYLEENKDSKEVIEFLSSMSPEVTLGTAQKYLADNEDGKEWLGKQLEAEADRRVIQAVKTYKEKTVPGLVEDAIKKANPDETPEQKQIRELNDKMDANQKELKAERMKTLALSELTAKKLPQDIVDLLIGDDEESTKRKIGLYEASFNKAVAAGVEAKFKANGRDVPGGEEKTDLDGKVNPWKKETFNLTMQGKIVTENPKLAEQMKAAAK